MKTLTITLKKLFLELKNLRATLRLYEAKKQADEAHERNGRRYYVMPTTGTSGQLVIMDRENFRKLKQKGYIKRHTSVKDLEHECFYCTPYCNGRGELSSEEQYIKRRQYFSWLEAIKK